MRRLFESKNIAITAGLGMATLWFFREVAVYGHILWGSDFIGTYLPYKQFLYEEIQQHASVPLWNPYLFGGMPFWAFFESTIFYPLDLLFWLIPPEKAYGYTMALHVLLAGLSMYALCQTLRLSVWASFLAALVFSYNGFIMPVLFLGRMVHVQSYAWAPLVLCFFVGSFRSERGNVAAIGAGLCWGLQILAADPQTAFYTYGALVLFALLYSGVLSSFGRCLNAVKCLSIVFVTGVGLAAIQIVPASELVRLSIRGTMKSYELVTLGSFSPQGLITAFLPNFFGNLHDDNLWVANTPWSFPGYGLYVGVIPLLLIPFVKYRKGNQAKLGLFCVVLGITSVILAMGKYTPIYRLVYFFPGFDSFRAPSKAIVLWVLAVSVLAGKGLDDFATARGEKSTWKWIGISMLVVFLIAIDVWLYIDPENTLRLFSWFLMKPVSSSTVSEISQIIRGQLHRLTVFATLGSVVLYIGFKQIFGRKGWLVLSIGVLLLDLGALNCHYIRVSDTPYSYMRAVKEELAHAFKEDTEVFRVGGLNAAFGPNVEMYYGLQSPAGAGPLILYRYYLYCDQFCRKVGSGVWQVLWYGIPGSEKFMDMLNVKYEIDYKDKEFSLRGNFLPRAMLVPDFEVVSNSRALAYMASEEFNPRRTLLLEENPRLGLASDKASEAMGKELGTCQILRYRPDDVMIDARLEDESFLVLNDIYYPGWKCYVDGKPQEILRCNYLFRAVALERGNHEVHFVFEPPLVKVGIAVTVIILLLCLFIVRSAKST